MNFNYDLMTWFEYFIGAFFCCLGAIIAGYIMLESDKKIKFGIKNFLIIVFLTVFTVFNSLIFNNVAKIIGILLMTFIICKFIYNQNTINTFIYGIIIYILLIISEAFLSVILILIEKIFSTNIIYYFNGSLVVNIVVTLIASVLSIILKNVINNTVERINKDSVLSIIILGVLTIFITLASLYDLASNNWIFNYKFILNMIVIFGFLASTIILLKQYLKNVEITNKYLLLNDYLKTSAEIIEKYSSTIHKYKNNLIAIKGYIEKDNQEAKTYVDNLLGNYNNKKYNWFNKINKIEIDVIRYLFYYKLSKAETKNLNISINVSDDLKRYDNNIITVKESNIVLEILGEYFDNAIYASSESKEKELNLMLYCEDNNLIFNIANTYKGEIDLSMIVKNGYTTKGNGHGLGLYDIEKTVKSYDWIETSYDLFDKYFLTSMKIKIKNK